MTTPRPPSAAVVRSRAAGRCEYCRMHDSLQGATFHVDHVRPRSQGGPSTADNLAWCCPSCNLHKSTRTGAVDPKTGRPAALFHPRQDIWTEHFKWLDHRLHGRTPHGRATVELLHLNTARRLMIRRAERRFGLFPPE